MKYCAILLMISSLLNAGMIITEVMFNTAADENQDEFIEIYNNSDSTIDLSGWAIADNAETDLLIKYHGFSDMLLKPYSYCVVMDSSYYLNSTEYEDLIPDSVLRVMINDGSMGQYGLSNSYNETIKLFDPDSILTDSVTYDCTQAEGYTYERVSHILPVWAKSTVTRGTPGFRNSVMPFENDIMLKLTEMPSPIDPEGGNTFKLTVTNTGLSTAGSFRLSWSVDGAAAGDIENSTSLAPGDSLETAAEIFFQRSGTTAVAFEAETDLESNLADNIVTLNLFVPYPEPPLTINEFMKNPAAGQCEYIEICNISGGEIDLGDFALSDENKANAVFFPDSVCLPGDLIVMAKDEQIYNFSGVLNSRMFIAPGLAALNNTDDTIFLIAADGLASDSVSYEGFDDDAGRSIEKINPDFASDDPGSWVYCVSDGTPTIENSVYQAPEDIGTSANFSISPKTATPNEDGDDDNLLISYEFDSAYVYLTMKIFNIKGQLISMPKNGDYCSSSGSIVWNCRSESGKVIDTGAYICMLKARDDKSRTTELKEVFYIAK
ncbi:MAG: lamin tail domain-containing protein [Candidatus Delongbacteria bacterium]|nr:lamin tail domain-containing protein [Candidatus Delongbacteria bacterium]